VAPAIAPIEALEVALDLAFQVKQLALVPGRQLNFHLALQLAPRLPDPLPFSFKQACLILPTLPSLHSRCPLSWLLSWPL